MVGALRRIATGFFLLIFIVLMLASILLPVYAIVLGNYHWELLAPGIVPLLFLSYVLGRDFELMKQTEVVADE